MVENEVKIEGGRKEQSPADSPFGVHQAHDFQYLVMQSVVDAIAGAPLSIYLHVESLGPRAPAPALCNGDNPCFPVSTQGNGKSLFSLFQMGKWGSSLV